MKQVSLIIIMLLLCACDDQNSSTIGDSPKSSMQQAKDMCYPHSVKQVTYDANHTVITCYSVWSS